MMSCWQDLFVPDVVLRGLEDLKFDVPTPIQQATLPAAIKGRCDVVGAAETGSGKTLAFAIPMLHGILLEKEREAAANCNVDVPDVHRPLRGLVLTPTRELAIQVKNHIAAVAKYTGIRVVVVVGGMAPQKQERLLRQSPDIVVATPGRLWDLIQSGNQHLSQVVDIRFLVIDETDRMVEKGHFEELQQLLELINADEAKKKRRQNFIFSATLTLVHAAPKHVLQKRKKKAAQAMSSKEKLLQISDLVGLKPKAKVVDLTPKVGTADGLAESCIHGRKEDKDFFLYYFLKRHLGRTLVFCNSIDCVRRLVNLFALLRCNVLGLHAQMHQKQRLKNLERFVSKPDSVLIATDVAARGLDIPDVEHVVHYQVPRTSENYIHRSGRTARANKQGVSVMFIDPGEDFLYRRMCKTLNRDKELPIFPVNSNMMAAVKARVCQARLLDKQMLSTRKQEAERGWWKKAARDADLIVSDEEESGGDEDAGSKANRSRAGHKRLKTSLDAMKRDLDAMLDLPLIGSSFSGKYPTMSGKLVLPPSMDDVDQGQSMSALKVLQDDQRVRKRILQDGNVAGAIKAKRLRRERQRQRQKRLMKKAT